MFSESIRTKNTSYVVRNWSRNVDENPSLKRSVSWGKHCFWFLYFFFSSV